MKISKEKIFTFIILTLLFLYSGLINGCHRTSGQAEDTSSSYPDQEKKNNLKNKAKGSYPVILENAGRTLTFQSAPKRVVALMQQDAELLLALGLKDRLVGYSLVTDETPTELARQLENIPVLAKQTPSKEVLLGANPDFVIGSEISFIDNVIGTRARLQSLGIATYVTKDEHPATIENQVYKEIRDMAHIFGVPRRGKALIQTLQIEIDLITDRLHDIKKPLKVVYMAGGKGGTVQVAGGNSLDSYLMELAGGQNIFDDLNGYLVPVSWEEIIERNPDVIVISYCCGSGPNDLLEVLAHKPSLRSVNAVKNKRYVTVQVEETTGSMRIPAGLKKLAKGFYPQLF